MSDQTNRRLSSITLLVIFLACVSIWAVPDTAEAETQSLVVETVPAIEGIQFQLDGETFVTDEAGVAQMTTETQKGYGMLEVAEHSLIGDSQRVEFEAWSDGVVTATRAVEFLESNPLQVGFNVDYLVDEHFRSSNGETIDPQSVDSFTIVDDTNDSTTFNGSSNGLAGPTAQVWERFPPNTRWLRAIRIVRQDEAIEAKEVSYRVLSVTVEGERATVAPDPFVPSTGAAFPITVDASSISIAPIAVGAAVILLLAGCAVFLIRAGRGSEAPARRDPVLSPEPIPQKAVPPERSSSTVRVKRGPVSERIARRRPPAEVYVRAKLRNGRTVEGWKMEVPYAQDSQAINVNVRYVYGPDGEQVAPRPLDSFLLTSQIVDLQIQEDQPRVPG